METDKLLGLDDLPPEILTLIAEHLGAIDLARVGATCKYLNSLAEVELIREFFNAELACTELLHQIHQVTANRRLIITFHRLDPTTRRSPFHITFLLNPDGTRYLDGWFGSDPFTAGMKKYMPFKVLDKPTENVEALLAMVKMGKGKVEIMAEKAFGGFEKIEINWNLYNQ